MKHLTKVFVIIALLIFVIGIILQFLGKKRQPSNCLSRPFYL